MALTRLVKIIAAKNQQKASVSAVHDAAAASRTPRDVLGEIKVAIAQGWQPL
jgi:hypothetical protein